MIAGNRIVRLRLTLAVVAIAATAAFSTSLRAAEPAQAQWKVVNYWSEWCAPCRVEIPMFNELSADLADSGVTIVGVNFDDDPRDVTLAIAEEMGIAFSVLTMEEIADLKLRPPDVLPTTYILSSSDEVVAKLIGQQTRQDIVDELIGLGLAPPAKQGRGHQ